jgi:Holliday junction resolvasome RuvABC endonuclease subunit
MEGPRVKVLGIDPGGANCGFALVTDGELAHIGTYRSDVDALLRDRMSEFVHDVLKLIDATKPDVIVTESPGFPEGKLAAVMTWSSYTGLVALAAARRVELVTYTPGEWRGILGLPVERAEKIEPGNLDEKELKRRRGKAARAAKERRKAGTVAAMKTRHPRALYLLGHILADAREHAWDALGIGTAFADHPNRRQGVLFCTKPVVNGVFTLSKD